MSYPYRINTDAPFRCIIFLEATFLPVVYSKYAVWRIEFLRTFWSAEHTMERPNAAIFRNAPENVCFRPDVVLQMCKTEPSGNLIS